MSLLDAQRKPFKLPSIDKEIDRIQEEERLNDNLRELAHEIFEIGRNTKKEKELGLQGLCTAISNIANEIEGRLSKPDKKLLNDLKNPKFKEAFQNFYERITAASAILGTVTDSLLSLKKSIFYECDMKPKTSSRAIDIFIDLIGKPSDKIKDIDSELASAFSAFNKECGGFALELYNKALHNPMYHGDWFFTGTSSYEEHFGYKNGRTRFKHVGDNSFHPLNEPSIVTDEEPNSKVFEKLAAFAKKHKDALGAIITNSVEMKK